MKKRILALILSTGLLLSTASALDVEQARELLREKYVTDIPEEILALPTVEEILDALGDPYTRYMDAQTYQAFLDSMNDTALVGVGVVVSRAQNGGLYIEQVLEDSPAQQAGLTAGDIILAVDGQEIAQLAELEQAAALLQGEEGTTVSVLVLHTDGAQETVKLVRSQVTVPHTTYELVDGHIGVVECGSFGEETYSHFVDAIDEYGAAADRWIVDLRENGGGLLQGSADALGIFTGQTVVGYLQDGDGQLYSCVPKQECDQTLYPAIVLTSDQTASAAEIYSAAIRDCQSGVIIGQRTFGKGVAQEVLDETNYPEQFQDGDAMTVTAMRFYAPGGATSDQTGVIPTLVVDPALTEQVALLLCASSPQDGKPFLRLHLGGWRWYVDLEQASEEYPQALAELLEAIAPGTDLFVSEDAEHWTEVTVEELAEDWAPDYTPRTFADAQDSPYRNAIDTLAIYGLIRGNEEGEFDPEGELTRAQVCALLAQALNLRLSEGESMFSDVSPDAWYAQEVEALYRTGLISGCGDGTFRPDDILTHEEFAVIMGRTAAWLNVDFGSMYETGPAEGTLEDPALLAYSEWAREEVCLLGRSLQNSAGEYGSMLYDDIEDIDPSAVTTREEAAMSLYRVLSFCGVL